MHNSITRGLITFTILASLGLQAPASAQPPTRSSEPPPRGSFLGLQSAVELALQNHPAVQEGNANLKASEARTEQTRSLYYPQVYANADTTAGAGRPNPRFLVGGALLQQNQSIFAAGVIANQRIYDFGVTSNLVESSQLAERAQGQDVNARRALVILNVQRTYLNSLKRRKLVQIAEETVRERGLIAGQIEALYRQQLKSKLDWNLVRVELVNAESFLVRSRNDLKSSYADINRAMGVVGTRRLRVGRHCHRRQADPSVGLADQRQLVPSGAPTSQRTNGLGGSKIASHEATVSPDDLGYRERWNIRAVRCQAESADWRHGGRRGP